MENLYGTSDLAELMQITPAAVRMRWLTGVIPKPLEIKGRYFWLQVEIDKLLEEQPDLIGSRKSSPTRLVLKNVG